MPNQIISSHLAAHAGIRQVNAVLRAETAANAVDRAIGGVWQAFLSWLSATHKMRASPGIHQQARSIFADLLPRTGRTLQSHLSAMAMWGHRTAAANVVKTLPAEWLAVVVLGRMKSGRMGPGDLESILGTGNRPADRLSNRLQEGTRRRPISGGDNHFRVRAGILEGDKPGAVQLALDALHNLYALDRSGDLREPAREQLTDEDAKALFARILFPPPSEGTVRRVLDTVLGMQTWHQALDSNARMAEFGPDRLASVISQRHAAGDSQREIAKAVLPFVDGVRYRARRTARTYCLAIAHEIQMEAHAEIADLTEGWQVHATLDQWTRTSSDHDKNHRMRNGTIYYVRPGPGQKGLDKMPRPPVEYDGELAYNCRCYVTPVLAPPHGLTAKKLKVFTNAKNKAIPDPAVYSDWFAKAPEKARRLAVGSKRYSLVQKLLGRDPGYDELVDYRTGDLLSLQKLGTETHLQRKKRVQQVGALIAQRRELIQQVSTFGFVHGRTR